MTVNELYKDLKEMIDKGYGNCKVVTPTKNGETYNYFYEVNVAMTNYGTFLVILYSC